ncbi:cupin-like domain-containing protein [Marinagarivorans algicola]|uniref:cupin-like domain-containing protein n=1 Tax=Marinagarivorans algicola TaxID=1513270 RepID=UPI000B010CF4|nr:cupin-like domain-containing protein [Marinagarivorans algicola]
MLRGGTSNDYYLTANNNQSSSQELKELFEDVGEFGDGYRLTESVKRRSHLWFGPKGTCTQLHHDLTNNMLLQVYGRKKITLIPAFQVPNVYNDSHVYSAVDFPNVDLERYPKMSGVTPLEVILNPGEAIFIPIGWWHQVESLDISISVSFTDFRAKNNFFSNFPRQVIEL